jgi:hypothetical protein
VPVPVALAVVEPGVALLVNVSVALAEPVVCGLNVTENPRLWPAPIVTGKVKPVMVNAELLELAPVTVTLAPLAVRLPVPVPVVPSTTLPTAIVAGLAESCPGAAVPVPESGMVRVGLEAFDVTVTLPLSVAAVVGSNPTLNEVLCPAPSVTGVAMPLTLNPVPLAATWEIVTLALPVFVIVSDVLCGVFTCVLPKLMLVGLEPNVPTGAGVPVPESGIESVGLEAFDVTVTLPLSVAAVVGSKLTLNDVLCPAVSVTGVAIPLTLNPVPLAAT